MISNPSSHLKRERPSWFPEYANSLVHQRRRNEWVWVGSQRTSVDHSRVRSLMRKFKHANSSNAGITLTYCVKFRNQIQLNCDWDRIADSRVEQSLKGKKNWDERVWLFWVGKMRKREDSVCFKSFLKKRNFCLWREFLESWCQLVNLKYNDLSKWKNDVRKSLYRRTTKTGGVSFTFILESLATPELWTKNRTSFSVSDLRTHADERIRKSYSKIWNRSVTESVKSVS